MNGDFELGEWAVHPKLNAVVRNDTSRHVSPKAVEVLVFLAERQGDVVSKDELLAAVWPATFVTDDALTRCIGELRRVFEDDAREPAIIQTFAKRGYRLVPPVRWLKNGSAGQHNGDTKTDHESVGAAAPGPWTGPPLEGQEAGTVRPEDARTTDAAASAPAVVVHRVSRRVTVAVAALSLMLIAGVVAGVAVMAWLRPVHVPGRVVSTIDLEPGYVLASRNSRAGIPTRTAMAISSDGSFVVYSARREGAAGTRLFLRRLAEPHATAIAGTEGARAPFLSPDDRRVGFVANGDLKWVPIGGGPAVVLRSSVSLLFGASWGADDYIAFSSGVGLYRVHSDGRAAEVLTTRVPGEFNHRLPHPLPRGKGVLFTVLSQPMDPQPRIAVVDDAHETRTVLADASDARYVATGHLVFLRRGALMAVPFDLDRLRTTGQAVSLGIGVAQATNEPATTEETDAGQFAVSAAGTLVYVAGGIALDEQRSLVWVEQDGREGGLAVPFTGSFVAARLSPDGRKIAYTVAGTKHQVCVYDVNGGAPSVLTDGGYVNFAIWTRDSQRVVFGWSNSGPPSLLERPVDQSAPAQTLAADKACAGQGPGSFSPDGNLLAFWRQFPDKPAQILILDRRSRAVTPFMEGRPREGLMYPEFSRDGRWLAYTSNESGRGEVYVRAYPQGSKWPISSGGGTEPLWSRRGTRLFYRSGSEVWAVDLEAATGLRSGKPQRLFRQAGDYWSIGPGRSWDLSLDDRRFLMVKREETKQQPVTQLVLVQNWTRELQRLFETREPGQ